MKILLDAYFDNNFGDDLFVSTILSRYPQAQFYVLWNKVHPQVLQRAWRFPNLVILPEDCELQSKIPFDAYVMIGGDVLPDGIDYTKRIERMQAVKQSGGFVAMLGFSLYSSYGDQTRKDLQKMAMLADDIVARDKYSAQRFQMLVPEADVVASTDMAFTLKDINDTLAVAVVHESKVPILGVAPRRKLYSTQEEYQTYVQAMAAVADQWLKLNANGMVRFLAFSGGEYNDSITSTDIIDAMEANQQTEVVAYTGDITAFQSSIQECSALLPTRFHAMVFALLYDIPFVAVPYEAKSTQLLDEIGYAGVRIPYGASIEDAALTQAVSSLCQQIHSYDEEALVAYQQKAGRFFEKLDRFVKDVQENNIIISVATDTAPLCGKVIECEELKQEVEQLKEQEQELRRWIASLQEQKDAIEAQYHELDAIRLRQWERLEQTTADYAALDERYQKLRKKIPFLK